MPSDASDPRVQQQRLERLRGYRNRPERDLSLGFLSERFKREVAGPFKQLEGLIEPWRQTAPAEMIEHCRLESLRRGTLTIAVPDHSRMYELDVLMRNGLQKKLIEAMGAGQVRRIKLRLDASIAPPSN
jgi:hypothetical protein